MAALALMILVTAILATGATRVEVYRSNMGRVGGRIASACFILITLVLCHMYICYNYLLYTGIYSY